MSCVRNNSEQSVIGDEWRKWLPVLIEVGVLCPAEEHANGLDAMEHFHPATATR